MHDCCYKMRWLMKIEMGESIILSWLRHVKECQIVQTNWKPSQNWDVQNKNILEDLLKESSEEFKKYNLFKPMKSNESKIGIGQILKQAEIDLIGISFGNEKCKKCKQSKENRIYAVDIAFHEKGLNYGKKEETISIVLMKYVRTAMCLYGYYGVNEGTIIFASPKIGQTLTDELLKDIEIMKKIINKQNLNYEIILIANHDFRKIIMEPITAVLGNVADTTELFMRSLQMFKLVTGAEKFNQIASKNEKNTKGNDNNEYKEMKIGVIARTVFRNILAEGKIGNKQLLSLMEIEYSRKEFGINYAVLKMANENESKSPDRYYASIIEINDKKYYLCSEWYESSRDKLIKWINDYQDGKYN